MKKRKKLLPSIAIKRQRDKVMAVLAERRKVK